MFIFVYTNFYVDLCMFNIILHQSQNASAFYEILMKLAGYFGTRIIGRIFPNTKSSTPTRKEPSYAGRKKTKPKQEKPKRTNKNSFGDSIDLV